MSITNNETTQTAARGFKKADAYLRPRLVMRDGNGNLVTGEDGEVKKFWVCKDIPIYENSQAAKSMIVNSTENPEFTYELQATVHVPGTSAEKPLLDFGGNADLEDAA